VRVMFVHQGRESLGLEYLSAVLKRAGHQTALALDPGLFGENDNVICWPRLERLFDPREALLAEIAAFGPDAVGFSVYTNTYRWSLAMAAEIKRRLDVPIVFGGTHATLVPDEVMTNAAVDFAVVGEGEEAAVELVDALAAGRDATRIANVWARRGGQVVANAPRPPIHDLDGLPLPDKSLFAEEINFSDDYLLLTSRGCVFNCSYCCESAINRLYGGRFYRRRSVDSVMRELVEMKRRFRFREVMFNDAILFADKDWLRDLMARYRREIGVRFRCFGQVRLLDEEVGQLLKDGGCYAVEFGVQTMNEVVRREVLNRRETNRHNARAFRFLDDLGISYDVDHIFGLPHESPADHAYAARFYSRWRHLNRIKCHNLTYFPTLGIVDLARREGLLTEADVAAIRRGEVGDFFHERRVGRERQRAFEEDYQVFFKLLGLFRPRTVERILRRGWVRCFGRLPGWLILFGQALIALRHRDYRFLVYLKYYPVRLRSFFRRRRRAVQRLISPAVQVRSMQKGD
jgi:anaerobic magnesium-protoporphyrin IX monomethyl ester cyclase